MRPGKARRYDAVHERSYPVDDPSINVRALSTTTMPVLSPGRGVSSGSGKGCSGSGSCG